MSRAITIPSGYEESDYPLRNFKLLDIILECAGVKDSASVARVDKFLRRFTLLKYGFWNENDAREIFRVIDESFFAAGWDFLNHAEYNLLSRIEDDRIQVQLIKSLSKKRKFPPKEVEFDLFYYSTHQFGKQNHHTVPFRQFDKLIEIFIPDAQLKQKSDYRINTTSNRLRGLLGKIFENNEALEILKKFLADADKETGISSSTLCWKSALLWQVSRNDIRPVIKIFKGLFFIVSGLLLIASGLVFCTALAIAFLAIAFTMDDPRLCRNKFRWFLVVFICPFFALHVFSAFIRLFHCSIPKFSVLNDEQHNCVKQRLRFFEIGVLAVWERMVRLLTLFLLIVFSITLGKIIVYSISGKNTESNWNFFGGHFLFLLLSAAYHKCIIHLLKRKKQQLSDARQYYRGNHWLRFFHHGVAKQENRINTHAINIDPSNDKKLI